MAESICYNLGMGRLLRKGGNGKSELPKFTPNLASIWNREYCLDFDLKAETFVLAMDYEIFNLPGYDYRDRSRLKLDRAIGVWELRLGPLSTVRVAHLAKVNELTEIYYHHNRYIHERDNPAPDTPAVQVLMMLRFGDRFLRFSNSDYAKFSYDYNGPKLPAFLKGLAELSGAQFKESSGTEHLLFSQLGWPGKSPPPPTDRLHREMISAG